MPLLGPPIRPEEPLVVSAAGSSMGLFEGARFNVTY